MKNIFVVLISSLLYFVSCNIEPNIEYLSFDYGYEYYPTEVGKFIIYDVDSIVFDLTSNGKLIDTTSYQVKEEIVDTMTDNSGRTAFIIHYSTRDNSSDNWTIQKVYTTVIDNDRVERTEDNLRFVKMVFPLRKEASWDGNQLFPSEGFIITVRGETIDIFKNWTSSIIDKNVAESINTQQFDDVLIIHHADYENNIERRFVEEKYARNVGLVSKTMLILDTQCGGTLANCEGIPWEEKAEKGFILNMAVNSYN